MLKFLFILIGLLPLLTLRAQQVTNIQVTQEGDNVVITYDISSDKSEQIFDIKVECSADNGKTFSIKPKSLSGDLKGIKVGTGKRIVWDVLSERQELTGDQFVFQLALSNSNSGNSGIFTDSRDGQVYKWIRIGSQVWMAENLKATKFNNGTSILNITDNEAWANLKTPGNCWSDNDIANKNTYGALYNWYAVNTGKLAPIGWHIPTDTEWTTLTNYLGGESVAGGKLKETDTTHWVNRNIGATNESGFTALPGGYRDYDGTFFNFGGGGSWWSSTEFDTGHVWFRFVLCYGSELGRSHQGEGKTGFSVRCVRD